MGAPRAGIPSRRFCGRVAALRTWPPRCARRGSTCTRARSRRQLRGLGFSLQANRKAHEGADHPDRDAQFNHIAAASARALAAKEPLISVDTKKKELIGSYKNAGRELAPTGRPVLVNTHDFPDQGCH